MRYGKICIEEELTLVTEQDVYKIRDKRKC